MSMNVQKLSVELNKFGVVEVSAKIGKLSYEMSVICEFGRYEGWVTTIFAVSTGSDISLANVGSSWDFKNRLERACMSEEGIAVHLHMFEAAERFFEARKPAPAPTEEVAQDA